MGHTGFISMNAIKKRHMQKHLDNGLCLRCSRKLAEDSVNTI